MLIYLQVIDAPEDRDQFITLYETYRGLMFYVANQILQNEQDAEDAVHDAFLSVAEHIKKFSRLERHKTKAFLVTIADPSKQQAALRHEGYGRGDPFHIYYRTDCYYSRQCP